jgi:hypothetical protein
MPARVKIPQFTQKCKALLVNFGRQSSTANILGSESIADHNVALFALNDEILLNKWNQVVQHWTGCLPIVNWPSELLLTSPSISRIFRAAKSIFKPYYELFVAARYLKHAMPLKATAIFALFYIANIEASFAVYKPRKISDLRYLMLCNEFYYFTHISPIVSNSIMLNEGKVYRERLNEMALERGMRKSELLSKDAEDRSKNLSRLVIGH